MENGTTRPWRTGRAAGSPERWRVTTGVLLALSLAAAVSACGDDDGGGDGLAAVSPLREAMGGGDWSDAVEGMLEHDREAEEAVAACMAEHGFEYVANAPDVSEYAHPSLHMSPREFMEEYGYGVSTIDETTLGVAEEGDDPNAAIVAALDEAEEEAYLAALHGEFFGGEGDGCRGLGQSDASSVSMEVVDEFYSAIDDLEARVAADPRAVEAEAAWRSCMVDAGYPALADEHEIWDHLYEKLRAVPRVDGQPSPEWGPFAHEEFDADALAALQEEELAMAATDQRCRDEHHAPLHEVRIDLETAFVEEQAELIEQMSGE